MKDIIIDSLISAKSEINTKQRRFCFELLGFDFLIDEDFRVWLLEVNNNPYIFEQNREQGVILKQMLSNIFRLTLDPLLPQHDIKVNEDPANLQFKLIYSDYQNLNTRGSYNKENLYPFPEFNQFISKK